MVPALTAPAGSVVAGGDRRREPEATPLDRVLAKHLATILAEVDAGHTPEAGAAHPAAAVAPGDASRRADFGRDLAVRDRAGAFELIAQLTRPEVVSEMLAARGRHVRRPEADPRRTLRPPLGRGLSHGPARRRRPVRREREFHTFVWDGPVFTRPVPVETGEIVEGDGFDDADGVPREG